MAENISIGDPNLVALYRYDDGTYESGTYPLNNRTLAPSYFGTNSMVSSGTDEGRDTSGPPNAPYSSGKWFGSGLFMDGFEEPDFFEVSAISGNMSGVHATSGDSLTIGTWVNISGWDQGSDMVFLSRATDNDGGDGFWFVLGKQFDNISKNQEYYFEWGIQSGFNRGYVESTAFNSSGVWQHVVGVIDSDTQSASIYVDGELANDVVSSEQVYAPDGSGTTFDLIVPFRIGAQTYDATDLWVVNGFGTQFTTEQGSGWLAETFVMNRALSHAEVSGLYASGFQPVNDSSDTLDSQKDNLGDLSSTAPSVIFTAWNPRAVANPSGMRQITSGVHPAFTKLLGSGTVSGLLFPSAKQGSVSLPVAVTLRADTSGTIISNIRAWISDDSAFTGVSGYEVAAVVASEWLPDIVIPSGSGVLGRTLADATIVLRSDGNSTISGVGSIDLSASGEAGVDISQYIYLAFDTNNDFTPGSYGPDGFQFRVSYNFNDV